jgi:hypothetical protein
VAKVVEAQAGNAGALGCWHPDAPTRAGSPPSPRNAPSSRPTGFAPMSERDQVCSPNAENYVVSFRRWNPAGLHPIALLIVFLRWLWRFGRWSVEVDRSMSSAELRRDWPPSAFRWSSGPMDEQAARDEFKRVTVLIREGCWPTRPTGDAGRRGGGSNCPGGFFGRCRRAPTQVTGHGTCTTIITTTTLKTRPGPCHWRAGWSYHVTQPRFRVRRRP